MENIIGNIVSVLFGILAIIIAVGVGIRLLKNIFAKEKSVTAIVVNKQCYEKQIARRAQAGFSKMEYVITFMVDGKKMYFDVPEFSYNGYKINDKGTLTYKGNKIIDFK